VISLYKQGDEFGDNAALDEAIDVTRQSLALVPLSERPLEWAESQNRLGAELARLGWIERDPARIKEAVVAYREVLNEWPRLTIYTVDPQKIAGVEPKVLAALMDMLNQQTQAVRSQWARIQINLGAALGMLGVLESGNKGHLDDAVAAYRAALDKWSRGSEPREWVAAQNGLGISLWSLGRREDGTKGDLEDAIAAFHAALEVTIREREPLDWADTKTNLGIALVTLGEREGETERLAEAVKVHREALQERSRIRGPVKWAETQVNLSLALLTLFQRDRKPRYLDDALGAIDGALEEFRKAQASSCIKMAERQRENILAAKGKL